MLARAFDVQGLIARLDARLGPLLVQAARTGARGLCSVSLAVPELSARSFPLLRPGGVYWSRSGEQHNRMGYGQAFALKVSGADRFGQLERAFERLRKDWLHLDPDETGRRPQAFVAFSFAPAAEVPADGSGMGDAQMHVPLLLLERDGSTCVLTLTMATPAAGGPDTVRERWLREAWTLFSGIGADDVPGRQNSAQVLTRSDSRPSTGRWLGLVDEALRAIDAGVFEKVVLSRRIRVRGIYPLQPERLLKWLESHYPGCVQFAFSHGSHTLAGASPERLVSLEGRSLVSDAVAGTMARGRKTAREHAAGEAMLGDAKARREHRLVVDDIVRALRPLCESLHVPAVPKLMTLPTLQHLWSPVHGRTRGPVSLLRLAARLHPTPAVGGVPRRAALAWLAARGETWRGWYTGGLGWIDAQGDGEIAVTLRCALLNGNTAELFAGAGIVAGSEPRAELAETEWKLRTMLDALARA